MISWGVKILVFIIFTFRNKNCRSNPLAFHLEWSFNTSVDKKSSGVWIFFELVFHFNPWFKLIIFFSLVLFSVGILKWTGEKLTDKVLNIDRQIFNLNFFDVTLFYLMAGGRAAILRIACQWFHSFSFY